MSEQDLQKFIKKVNSLKKMIESIEKSAERKERLASCSNHQEVVDLAKSWGFEIGERWGEK
ncbi:Nif11 family protein [Prochlorococcus sp. MIT 1223]|uniref:Nif11 family protein n=1 Tax=Prochlorococcus sp. MIT 1223 TaxID=3096217 RepID=UPI002A759928|nr:Nif11 family protein [Prochlorococcus sp. MIT 1223]